MKHSLVLLFVTLSPRGPGPGAAAAELATGHIERSNTGAGGWLFRGRNHRPSRRQKAWESNPHRRSSKLPGSPGSIDAGYPWISGVGATYRSTINLGEGPKLFGADFLLRSLKRRLYDRIGVRVSSVGGEPVALHRSSCGVSERTNRSSTTGTSYTTIFLPSFADPLAFTGQLPRTSNPGI